MRKTTILLLFLIALATTAAKAQERLPPRLSAIEPVVPSEPVSKPCDAQYARLTGVVVIIRKVRLGPVSIYGSPETLNALLRRQGAITVLREGHSIEFVSKCDALLTVQPPHIDTRPNHLSIEAKRGADFQNLISAMKAPSNAGRGRDGPPPPPPTTAGGGVPSGDSPDCENCCFEGEICFDPATHEASTSIKCGPFSIGLSADGVSASFTIGG
jgi:hypothetical protein